MISLYAPSTLPRSLRKRSLSSFSPVSLSQKRQVSGEISSARMMVPSEVRPNSILKSISSILACARNCARI